MEQGAFHQPKVLVLNFNNLRGLTPHPAIPLPVEGRGSRDGHGHYFFVVRHTSLLRFMGGGLVVDI
jgi:hypothetical protein